MTVVLPAYHVTELLWNKVFDEKERKKEGKKERKKERRKTILLFRPQAVSNSGNTTASVKHRKSFGSAQEYPVSIYTSITNL